MEFSERGLRNFSEALIEIHRNKVRLDDADERQAVEAFKQAEKIIGDIVKKSVFGPFYEGMQPKGSFFMGVKVGNANEFDIDICLNLNLPLDLVKIEVSHPAFIKIKVAEAFQKRISQNHTWLQKFKYLELWIDEQGYLDQGRFRRTIESMLTKELINAKLVLRDGREAFMRKCGPAFTFDFGDLSFDFVFVIKFPSSKWPSLPVLPYHGNDNHCWYAVPKMGPYQNSKEWRMSFSMQEKQMLHSKVNLKMVIRLMKAFRDCDLNNMKVICSYHIYTLFLNELKRQDSSFWNKNIGYLFVYMLYKLKDATDNKKLPFYWDKRYNLFEKINVFALENISNRLRIVIRNILSNEKMTTEAYLLSFDGHFADRLPTGLITEPICENSARCIIL